MVCAVCGVAGHNILTCIGRQEKKIQELKDQLEREELELKMLERKHNTILDERKRNKDAKEARLKSKSDNLGSAIGDSNKTSRQKSNDGDDHKSDLDSAREDLSDAQHWIG